MVSCRPCWSLSFVSLILQTMSISFLRRFATSLISLGLVSFVTVLRVGDAWLVGVGRRAPYGFQCLWLVSSHGSLDRLNAYALFPSIEC